MLGCLRDEVLDSQNRKLSAAHSPPDNAKQATRGVYWPATPPPSATPFMLLGRVLSPTMVFAHRLTNNSKALMKLLRGLVLSAIWIPALVGAQAPTGIALAQQSAAFRTCDTEGFMALNIARVYMAGGRKRDDVLPYVRGSAFGERLALELFESVDNGELKHYADFAAGKLQECAVREVMDLQQPAWKMRICYARTDIAFFLDLDRKTGADRQSAETKTAERLTNREVYPSGLIQSVARSVYALEGSPEYLRRVMGAVFWACLNSDASKGR